MTDTFEDWRARVERAEVELDKARSAWEAQVRITAEMQHRAGRAEAALLAETQAHGKSLAAIARVEALIAREAGFGYDHVTVESLSAALRGDQ